MSFSRIGIVTIGSLTYRGGRVSNPGKLYFPAVKLTKLDLVNYYVECEQAVVRGLRERPTVMKRWVDGVEGKPFFQKRVPDSAPGWLETATVTSLAAELSGGELSAVICPPKAVPAWPGFSRPGLDCGALRPVW